eukprot:CAMPEP_0169281026 /NCGR_PEP_ID=MMETSP1016-20121227/55982_1 /TAXON_ID=342587 /ORGANISM="Karlodinium micrum, Strain CCMP2283" /LENGTH=598 /DNA_ID=CAMNT_0009369513 /DNA_START=18 /DNA_END=1811 /DNA_ORIENTATION=+
MNTFSSMTASADEDDRGLVAFAEAAVPLDIRENLSKHFSHGTKDGNVELSALLHALASPPGTVCFRHIADHSGLSLDEVEASMENHLARLGTSLGCKFEIRRAVDMPPPISWLKCPEARIIMAERCNDPQVSAADNAADIIIDAACAMAVLRGADVFCMGVMATSPYLQESQNVRLWAVPEGIKAPNRGSILANSPRSWPAIQVAGGKSAMNRAAMFAQGAHGVAINVSWRRGTGAPLASMSSILADEKLSRCIILQQLPSSVAVRALAPCAGERVIDMCAAPGGKTTHLAELLGEGGKGLFAVDRSLAKVRRIEALCKAHGFSAVCCIAADSRHLCCQDTEAPACIQSNALEDDPGVQEESTSVGVNRNLEDSSDVMKPNASYSDNACVLDQPWPLEAEKAFQLALDEHGADRFRSSKRIWKAVRAAAGIGTVTRMQVNERLRQHGIGGSQLGVEEHVRGGQPSFPPGYFDRILLDPPCSAMGQRPLLRWGKTLSDVRDHAGYQRQFLRTAASLLRHGGELVYSTCTLTPEENEENVRWALDNLPLELLDAREHALRSEDSLTPLGLAGLDGCGLDESERRLVLRFDPRSWDAGFFV